MSGLDLAAILLAAAGAGAVNAVAGSGTLLTFPTLLALGVPPVVANVSNTVGLAPGGLAATWGLRRRLAGQGRRLARLAGFSAVGGLVGAGLLLVLPATAFAVVVPALIALGVVLVALQPRIARWAAADAGRRRGRPSGGPALRAGVGLTGAYGGYFGAAQGVLLVALLGIGLPDDLHVVNAMKNVLATVANTVAAIVFLLLAPVDPTIAVVVAAGSVLGGLLGARVADRIPAGALRALLVLVGVAAVVAELAG